MTKLRILLSPAQCSHNQTLIFVRVSSKVSQISQNSLNDSFIFVNYPIMALISKEIPLEVRALVLPFKTHCTVRSLQFWIRTARLFSNINVDVLSVYNSSRHGEKKKNHAPFKHKRTIQKLVVLILTNQDLIYTTCFWKSCTYAPHTPSTHYIS